MKNRFANIIKWARKTLPTSFGNFPQSQGKWLGKTGNLAVIYPYGTNGHAPVDSYFLMLSLNGDEANRAAIETDPSSLPETKLLPNEFETGNFVVGATIKFDVLGNIHITAKNDIFATAQNVTVNAEANVTVNAVGNVTATSESATINANTAATVTSPTITLNGNTTINGTLTVTGVTNLNSGLITNSALINGINFGSHVHGGVSSGGSNTGVPS